MCPGQGPQKPWELSWVPCDPGWRVWTRHWEWRFLSLPVWGQSQTPPPALTPSNSSWPGGLASRTVTAGLPPQVSSPSGQSRLIRGLFTPSLEQKRPQTFFPGASHRLPGEGGGWTRHEGEWVSPPDPGASLLTSGGEGSLTDNPPFPRHILSLL